jgi:hypothetical protein
MFIDLELQGVDPVTWAPRAARVTDWFDNGVREVFELKLRGGATICASGGSSH